ncbi:MAG: cold shock domain-containing protein [Aerococcus suis]|nr:cold shock domain-containing protein [Aerococcus suis]
MRQYYGIVDSYDEKKGFGFISLPDFPFEEDVFVHASAIQATGQEALIPEQGVRFSIVEGHSGPQAVNVQNDD